MMTAVRALYDIFLSTISSLRSLFLLVVRLYWGWLFATGGYGKIMHIEKVVGFFTSLNIPMPWLTAHFVAGLELVGGVLLFLGLLSRPIALVLAINMLAAYFLADFDALRAIFSDPSKFMDAAPFTFLFASMIVAVFGPGRYSLDAQFKLDDSSLGS